MISYELSLKKIQMVSQENLTWSCMLQLEVLIGELVSINALSSRSIVVGKVSSLTHELGDDAVERRSGKTESWFSSTQLPEILRKEGIEK